MTSAGGDGPACSFGADVVCDCGHKRERHSSWWGEVCEETGKEFCTWNTKDDGPCACDGFTKKATIFDEDCEVGALLDRFDFVLDRRESIEIEDQKPLEELGLMRKCPDYGKIRRILRDGGTIPGVKLRGIEYILRKRSERDEAKQGSESTPEGSAD